MSHHYAQHAVELKAELSQAVPRDTLRALHRKSATRHFLIAGRQFAILAAATWGLITFDNPLVWIPLAFVQGFTIFNFTILLHEVLHHNVFERPRPLATRILGLLYATPALFPIYFRAARKETVTYPAELQQKIGVERKVSIAAHLLAIAGLWYFFGFFAAVRTSIIPVFFIFPIAFTLNRLGQHYDIDPNDPAKWGTLMKGHWFWDFAYLNSNYHLEHHYFPGVPFYRLPALQRALTPFFERKQMRWMTYGRLVYGWIIENHAPHTDWSRPAASGGDARPVSAPTTHSH